MWRIAQQMLSYDTILFHGSVIAVDGEGYLFTAKSGTGKSTHARLWRENFGDRAVMVNDDKPPVMDNERWCYCLRDTLGRQAQTQYQYIRTNTSVPLKGICILERSAKNHIIRLDTKEQIRSPYPMIVQQTVKARLKNIKKETGRTMQDVLIAYGLERTIMRLTKSSRVENFTLKGGIFCMH